MSEPKDQNEAADGGSALTAGLGALADQFECHALSRSIDDVEAAGRAMHAAKGEIERLRTALKLYIEAGFGNSTDFSKQGAAYDAAVEALRSNAEVSRGEITHD